jgi:hypothetical protein
MRVLRPRQYVTGVYFGGPILVGQVVGIVIDDETVDMRFQCLTVNSELKSGRSRATVSADQRGWSW